MSSAEAGAVAGIKLFLAGDVMTGRGIDQILPHPGNPRIYEPYVNSADRYVQLAEEAHGAIPRPADFSYVWGDALADLRRVEPDARIINLETSITGSETALSKGINYRMSPENVPCLGAASIDCCVLANNHVLDWDRAGLLETLDTLARAGIRGVGAGRNAAEASAPVALDMAGKGRVVIFAYGSETSGIPPDWAAGETTPGINLLPDLSQRTIARIAADVSDVRRPGDILVASLHWGGNWGYEIPRSQQQFAHHLVDAGFDLVHGHSSHHPKGIEVYREKLILYGCGDFLNDYEGIGGYEEYRGDLVLMYLPQLAVANGILRELKMVPFEIRQFRLARASRQDSTWLCERLDRECARFGVHATLDEDSTLSLRWG